jgi:bacillopeptidase F (M6 metalloprotease family)
MNYLRVIITMLIVSLGFTAALEAVALSDEVTQKLKAEGRFEQFVERMAEWRAHGVNQVPRESPQKFALAAPDTINMIVILIDFPDKTWDGGYAAATPEMFDSLLFSDGRKNPTGSMKEFYLENSYGKYVIRGTVAGWYRSTNGYAYYATSDLAARMLVREAIQAANADVDFTQFE